MPRLDGLASVSALGILATFYDLPGKRLSKVTAADSGFPKQGVERMAPYAASGGAIGPDGLLYILGHDRPEMYVLAKPVMGPSLIHVATIDVEAEGQAFTFAEGRTIFAIDRRKGAVREVILPMGDTSNFPDARELR